MSVSTFYTVRFSPAPELGEWLNVAVIGESIEERTAGVAFPPSMDRLSSAFGAEAVEAVSFVLRDLEILAQSFREAHMRGDPTPPIPHALRDLALTVGISEEIVVFEGSFQDALDRVAQRYLAPAVSHREVLTRDVLARLVDLDRITDSMTDAAKAIPVKFADHRSKLLARIRAAHGEGDLVSRLLSKGKSAPPSKESRILVAVGAGTFDAALVPRLLESGYQVRLLDLRPRGSGPLAKHPRLEVVRGDVKQLDRFIASLANVNAVVQAGELSLDAASKLAFAAKARGVERFVFVSLGAKEERLGVVSAATFDIRYDASIEQTLIGLADEAFHPTVLRFGHLYGAESPARYDSLVELLMIKAVLEGHVSIFDAGTKQSFLHLDDASHAVLQALEAPASVVSGHAFDVGSPDQLVTLGELGEMVREHIANVEIATHPGLIEIPEVDLLRFHDQTGFSTSWTLERGIPQILTALREGGLAQHLDSLGEHAVVSGDDLRQNLLRVQPASGGGIEGQREFR